MAIQIGVNLEYIRCEDKSFAEGVARAAEIGYKWCEPLVHSGYELLSGGGYYHSFSMQNDPYEMKDILDQYGIKPTALSAHAPLMRPEVAIPYMEQAIRFAKVVGAPVLTSDEGMKPDWVPSEEVFDVMKYTLTRVCMIAERYGISIGIEPHQFITTKTEGLMRVAMLVKSPMLRVNYDTGNAWLGGEDPYEGLKTVGKLLVHMHAKDISVQQSEKDRGAIMGTPVGCACGDGVIDWTKVIGILKDMGYDGALSVECGTPAQAVRSLEHLTKIING
jgi:sugar phosphate isomerase/epimerase